MLEKAVVDESAQIRDAAIRALNESDPKRAGHLATEWVNTEKDVIHNDEQVAFDRSFPLVNVLHLANKAAAKTVLINWLASPSVVYEELALNWLCNYPGMLDADLVKRVRSFTKHDRLDALAHYALACTADKGSADWLMRNLDDPEVRYVLLSTWKPLAATDPRLPLTPRLILESSGGAWHSPDQGVRLMICRFDMITGGQHGRQVLWWAALSQCVDGRRFKPADDVHFGAMSMSLLAEHSHKRDIDLAKIVFRSRMDHAYRIPAATLILRAFRLLAHRNDSSPRGYGQLSVRRAEYDRLLES